ASAILAPLLRGMSHVRAGRLEQGGRRCAVRVRRDVDLGDPVPGREGELRLGGRLPRDPLPLRGADAGPGRRAALAGGAQRAAHGPPRRARRAARRRRDVLFARVGAGRAYVHPARGGGGHRGYAARHHGARRLARFRPPARPVHAGLRDLRLLRRDHRHHALEPVPGAERAGLLGVVGMCCSPALVLGGLTFTRPEVVAVIVAPQPATTALAGWLVFGRRPARFTLACVIFAFFGAITVITRWNPSLAPAGMELVGVLMIVGGSLCWVAYTLGNPTFVGWSSLRFTTCTVVSGALGSCVLVTVLSTAGIVETPGPGQWLAALPHLLFLSFFGVLASMILWN